MYCGVRMTWWGAAAITPPSRQASEDEEEPRRAAAARVVRPISLVGVRSHYPVAGRAMDIVSGLEESRCARPNPLQTMCPCACSVLTCSRAPAARLLLQE